MNWPLPDLEHEPTRIERHLASVPSREKRRLRAYIAMILCDGAIILACFALAGWLYHGVWLHRNSVLMAYLLIPLYYTIALYNRSYSLKALEDWRFAATKAAIALLVSAALLNFIAFYTKSTTSFSRAIFSGGFAASLVLIGAQRLLVIQLIARFWRGKIRNVLVIDDGGSPMRFKGAAVVSAARLGLVPDREDPRTLDRLGRILRNQDRVIVSCQIERRADWAYVLKAAGVRGEIVSDAAEAIGAIGIERYPDSGRTTLVVSTGPLSLQARAIKRAFDLVVSLIALALLSPLLALVALAIKIEDGGKVLFIQPRSGRGNRLFMIYKFRTMREDTADRDGTRSTSRNDDRVTRVGKWLRRTSIDELPQLYNVVRGDMSIVGPRPHALGSRAGDRLFWKVDTNYWQRHALRPGLTGLAQIRGLRGATEREEDLQLRLRADLEYIANWSLWRDIVIVLKTIRILWHERAF